MNTANLTHTRWTYFKWIYFQNMEQIMQLHFKHIITLLIRIRFTKWEYINGSIHLTWSKIRFGILSIMLSCISLFTSILVSLRMLPNYSKIYEQALMIKNFHQFALMLIITFILMESVCLRMLARTINYNNKTLQLLCEYEATLDRMLNSESKHQMIKWYTTNYNYFRVYLQLIYFSVGIHYLQLLTYNIQLLNDGVWSSLLETIFYAIMSLSTTCVGLYSFIFGSTFMLDLVLFYKIFHYKMKQTIQCLSKCLMLPQQRIQLERFIANYTTLHRELSMYNSMSRYHIQMYDADFKLGGSVMMGVFVSQGSLSSSKAAMMVLSLFALSYLFMNCIFMVLAYFPNANLCCYQLFCVVCSKTVKTLTNPIWSSRNCKGRIRHLFQINSTIQYLAQSQLGFTNSTIYLIQKIGVFKNILFNIYLIILFYKKLMNT